MLNSILMMSFVFASSVQAEEGKFSLMPKGRSAPFKGVLFDESATSSLLAMPEKYKLQCDLDTEFQIDKLKTEHQLTKKRLELDIERLTKEHKIVLEGKEKQMENLNKELEKRIGINKNWYLAGGVAIGVFTTAGMFALWNSASGD
tara:strand:+ start:2606 stop:3043 length:438 start_codon:yes stop_codon:yes gene_type:complete